MSQSNNHDLNTKRHVSESVYMHSPELMMLVKEMYEHWKDEPGTEDIGGRTMWWYSGLLSYDPAAFIEIFNLSFTHTPKLMFDSHKEAELSLTMLNIMRRARNVAPLAGGVSNILIETPKQLPVPEDTKKRLVDQYGDLLPIGGKDVPNS